MHSIDFKEGQITLVQRVTESNIVLDLDEGGFKNDPRAKVVAQKDLD